MDRTTLERLNPGLPILQAEDEAFGPYGTPFIFEGLSRFALEAQVHIPPSPDANAYVASLPALEALVGSAAFAATFGFEPFEVGYCAGPNTRLNGMEYHKSPEIVVAVTELALLLGLPEELEDYSHYEASRSVCLFMPRGTAVELRPGVLHFSPCRLSEEPFKSVIVLPRGTNEALEQGERENDGEGRLLFMKNKWLIAHPERIPLVEKGALAGISGKNIEVRYR